METKVNYLLPNSTNIRYYCKGNEVNLGKYEGVRVIVEDARPQADQFTLDSSGFTLLHHISAVEDLHDRHQLDSQYGLEMAEVVKKMIGAKEVIVLSPPVLRRVHTGDVTHQPPAVDVHTDYSPTNAEWQAKQRIKDEHSRFVFINVWRPLTQPPQDWPLALIDARSVGAEEGSAYPMVVVDAIPDVLPMDPQPPYTIEGANFSYSPQHQWRYYSNMTSDEALVFKLYDSDHSKAWRCPHTSFHNETPGAVPRESVEVRLLLYFS